MIIVYQKIIIILNQEHSGTTPDHMLNNKITNQQQLSQNQKLKVPNLAIFAILMTIVTLVTLAIVQELHVELQ